MKVLQINAVYSKSSTGRMTEELHLALKARGIESFVASYDLCDLSENCYRIGTKVDRKVHGLLSRITGLQGYYSFIYTKKLLKYINIINPDIVHLGNLHGNYINLSMLLKFLSKNNIATVLTLHDSWFYTGKCVYYIEDNCEKWKDSCGNCPALKKGNKSWFLDRSRKMLKDKKKLFSRIQKLGVIGVSNWVTYDASVSILRNAKIIERIYNWIDLELFSPQDNDSLRKKMGLSDKKVVLGVSSFWTKQKGIEIFVELSKILPNEFKIVLVGNCEKNEYMNEKIIFLGTVENTEVLAQLYSMADIFVNPTIQETFGLTAAESIACGTPVVSYKSTATPEVIGTDDLCGLLIDKLTPEAFKNAIIEIAKNSKSKYCNNCRKRAEFLFDKDRNIGQYIKLYNDLIK